MGIIIVMVRSTHTTPLAGFLSLYVCLGHPYSRLVIRFKLLCVRYNVHTGLAWPVHLNLDVTPCCTLESRTGFILYHRFSSCGQKKNYYSTSAFFSLLTAAVLPL